MKLIKYFLLKAKSSNNMKIKSRYSNMIDTILKAKVLC